MHMNIFVEFRSYSMALNEHFHVSFQHYQKDFFPDFIYSFLESGEGNEKEREQNINVWLPLELPLLGTWPVTQACVLTRN